ncbi:MAG: hypothetical protein Q7T07_14690 [Burkholderiaceae bacterium]|nr:hypothetical protein [Burkholderiaceae bacterium]
MAIVALGIDLGLWHRIHHHDLHPWAQGAAGGTASPLDALAIDAMY